MLTTSEGAKPKHLLQRGKRALRSSIVCEGIERFSLQGFRVSEGIASLRSSPASKGTTFKTLQSNF